MAVLPIRHVAGSNPPRFQLQRPDGRTLPEVDRATSALGRGRARSMPRAPRGFPRLCADTESC
jgi:hypothetical protein